MLVIICDDKNWIDVNWLVVLLEFQENFLHCLILHAKHKVYLEVIDELSKGKRNPQLYAVSSIL